MSKQWIKKDSEAEDEPTTSPLLLEPSAGPTYDKIFLLGVATTVKKVSTAAEDDEQPSAQREVSLTARPDAAPEERSAAERCAQRALLEEAIASRLSNSRQFADDPDEVGTISVNAPYTPEPEAVSTAPSMIASYLQSMTAMYGANPMAMYGANPAGYTTVMLRNIPNRYTRDMLVERLNKNYEGQFDFVYLPIDFESTCNVGYGFVNFRTPYSATAFLTEFHNAETRKVLPGFSSRKVCEVSYARVQGLEANIDNLRDDKFVEKLSERPEWQPLFLDAMGEEIPLTQMMGSRRAGGRNPKGGTAHSTPGAMGGFMTPSVYGQMMYQPVAQSTPDAPSISISSILPSATGESMVMLRGVPLARMRSDVIDTVNEQFAKLYDFLFLPPDTKFQGNKGIMFINFRSTETAEEFTRAFHERKVSECFPEGTPAEGAAAEGDDEKICSVESAKVDVVEGIIARAQTAPPPAKLGVDRSRWQPLLFAPDGESLAFPLIATPGLQRGKSKPQAARTPRALAASAGAAEDEAAPAEGAAAEGAAESPAGGAAPAAAPRAKAPRAKGEKGAKGGKGKGARGTGKGAAPQFGQYPGYPYMSVYGQFGQYGVSPFEAHAAYVAQVQAHYQARAAVAASVGAWSAEWPYMG